VQTIIWQSGIKWKNFKNVTFSTVYLHLNQFMQIYLFMLDLIAVRLVF